MGSRMEKVRRPLRQPPNRKVRPKMKWVKVEKTVRLKKKAKARKNPPTEKS
jgi:hypothetical protein